MSLEQRLWQLRIMLWVMIWLALCVLVSIWSMFAGAAIFGVGGGLLWWLRSTGRGPFARRPPATRPPDDPAQREREARYMVTQLLRNLTRVQVTYLCQTFPTPKQGLSWLQHALPRGMRAVAPDLQQQLELARQGDEVPGARLALRVLKRRDELLRSIDALSQAHKDHPSHVVAHPVVFVITEHLTGDEGNDDPEVVTLAGWNPNQPTLLPEVDALNLFSEVGKERQIRGHAALSDVRRVLTAGELRLVNRDPKIYAVELLQEDPVRKGVKLGRVPLGFVIGTAEMM